MDGHIISLNCIVIIITNVFYLIRSLLLLSVFFLIKRIRLIMCFVVCLLIAFVMNADSQRESVYQCNIGHIILSIFSVSVGNFCMSDCISV